MSCKQYKFFSLVCLALGMCGCSLEDVKDGEYCPNNTDGSYALDSFSEADSGGSTSAHIVESRYCNGSYSYCVETICTMCPKDTVRVKLDDSNNEVSCLPCTELDACESNSCKKAREYACKGTCIEGELRNSDNKVIEVCTYGCNENGDACNVKPVSECEVGKILRADECVCDESNYWVADGDSCTCKEGFHRENNECVADVGGDGCKMGQIRDENDKCVCDEAHFWTEISEGTCACQEGYILAHNICEARKQCKPGAKLDESTNTCACDAQANWTGSDPENCSCQDGYLRINDACEAKKSCKTGAKLDESTNTCACDAQANWTGSDPENCSCQDGYLRINDACEAKKSCKTGAKLDESTNTCACDGKANWKGSDPENCTCKDGFLRINNACVEKQKCGTGAKLDESTNTCVCDKNNHWIVNNSGKCECEFGYKSGVSGCIKYQVGESFTFGKLEQNYNGSDGPEAIEWIILEVTEEYYLLLSKYGLHPYMFNCDDEMMGEYHDYYPDCKHTETPWAKSIAHQWINSTFLDVALPSSTERDKLWVSNSGDRVFLPIDMNNGLSVEGASKVFMTTNAERIAYPTKQFRTYEMDTEHPLPWWLAKDNSSTTAMCVDENGNITSKPQSDVLMIRPAIWVKIGGKL